MKNGEIVDKIVIDANKDLQWSHRQSLMHHVPLAVHRYG